MKAISHWFKSALMLCMGMVIPVACAAEGPADWNEWAKWAERLYPITDAQGHGPDIGSDEWAGAMDKRLRIRDADGHGPDVKSKEWRAAVEKKLMPKAAADEGRDLLSSHDTVAKFVGVKAHQCLGRTALCPDRCGHSGSLATFEIVKYLRYEKPGEYGDPNQERFQVLIEDNQKQAKVPAAIREAILALKPGDLVRLGWNHDYVTREGSKFPERPITKVEALTKEQAEKMTPQPETR